MIPRQVAEELGQPLPLFIKWDDADYGLRAAEHGYPTVTLPGAAIWHMAWSDKDDAIDWQAYFHLRNRLVVAAMHWDGDVTGLVRSHLKATLKHLACLEYSTVAIQNRAIDDFLAGPGAHLLDPGIGAAGSAPPAQGISGRGGAAGGQRAAGAVAQEQGDEAAGEPGGHRLPAGPRDPAQPDDGRPGITTSGPSTTCRPRTRAGSGCARSTASRSRPPTAAAWSTGSAIGAKMFSLLFAVAAPPAPARPPVRRDAQGVSRRVARAVQQAEVGDGAAAGSGAAPTRATTWLPKWLKPARRGAAARGGGRDGGRPVGAGRPPGRAARSARDVPLRRAQHRLGGRVALGAVLSPGRRRDWLVAGAGAFAAHAAAVLIKRVVRRKRPHRSGRCGQRRHPQPAELPVGACHVDHGRGDPDGQGRRAAQGWLPRCWCRRWRCREYCWACTIPATSPSAWRSVPGLRRSAVRVDSVARKRWVR